MSHSLGEAAAAAGVPLPPLPSLETDVAVLLQKLRQRWRLLELVDHLLPQSEELLVLVGLRTRESFRQRRVVGGDLVLVWVKAGDHRRQARTAEARRHITALEDEPLAGELVEVRRFDVFV